MVVVLIVILLRVICLSVLELLLKKGEKFINFKYLLVWKFV